VDIIVRVEVLLPDHLDADWFADHLESIEEYQRSNATWDIEVGRGERINGIPTNTILVRVNP
jgi:hypothetical protein